VRPPGNAGRTKPDAPEWAEQEDVHDGIPAARKPKNSRRSPPENISSGSDTFPLRRNRPVVFQFRGPVAGRRRQLQRPEEPAERRGDRAVDHSITELRIAQFVGDGVAKCVTIGDGKPLRCIFDLEKLRLRDRNGRKGDNGSVIDIAASLWKNWPPVEIS
jgi:hypothetical protein